MTFTCTYRDSTGARRTVVIEATSRADACTKLAAKGVHPLSLVQGGKLPRGNGDSPSRPRLTNGVAAGALVVVLALGAAYFMGLFGGGREPSPSVQPESPPAPVTTNNPSAVSRVPRGRAATPPAGRPASGRRESLGVASVPNRPASQPVEETPAETNDADMAEAVDPAVTNKPKRVFKTAAEELLALATPSVPGGLVPPLPHITDEGLAKDLEKAMSNVIKAEEGDTEKTLSMKLAVSEQKEEFRKLRKESGWTFTEYVNALRDKFNDDAAYLSEAHKLNDELFKDETLSDDEYKKNKKIIDDELKKRGLPSLDGENQDDKSDEKN